MAEIHAAADLAFVRREMVAAEPPPRSAVGPIAWTRANLFSGIGNTLLTLVGAVIAVWIVWKIVDFALVRAIREGTSGEACRAPNAGACWPYVQAYWKQFLYGLYPASEHWRINIVFALFFALLVPLLMPRAPFKRLNAFLFFVVFPLVTYLLLNGGDVMEFVVDVLAVGFALVALVAGLIGIGRLVGGGDTAAPLITAGLAAALAIGLYLVHPLEGQIILPHVETNLWGGVTVSMVVAVTGIVVSLPLGILLALGRRSRLPVIRLLSIIYIEFWRGVPLITVLFMASNMLPLFMPTGVDVDKLLRALIGVAMFASAYMAEVVRGGLQAIPKGQYEGAMALGLNYPKMMSFIVLPQALKLVIPGIVNTFIGLFKDTTLVLIVSIFDLLGQIQFTRTDPTWTSPTTAATGYLVAALFYFVFCFGMSRYSIWMERRLNTGRRR